MKELAARHVEPPQVFIGREEREKEDAPQL
jgi:hypothetical protein